MMRASQPAACESPTYVAPRWIASRERVQRNDDGTVTLRVTLGNYLLGVVLRYGGEVTVGGAGGRARVARASTSSRGCTW
jgi:hypothetical protein